MPYAITTKAGYLHIHLCGKVTAADLNGIADQLGQIEATAETTPPRLVDFSEVEETVVNFPEMNQVMEKRRSAQLKNDVKLAVVAQTPIQFGYARMFQTLNANPRIELALFADLAAALRWLLGTTPGPDHPARGRVPPLPDQTVRGQKIRRRPFVPGFHLDRLR
jgi:hypothetical protein